MNTKKNTITASARHAAQAAAQAALALNRAGYHDAAKAIWDASKGVIAA